MIPLVSSLCRGMLGVGHLPRFWWKNMLHAAGRLDAAYPHTSGGLDRWVVQLLGLDLEATQGFLWDERPDYLAFEDWVRQHGDIRPATVARWNKGLAGRTHVTPAKVAEVYADIGYGDEVEEVSAVRLNCRQDWQLFYRDDLQKGLQGPLPPLISSIDRGPWGMCQLPRTWLKTCLRARGILHEDYPDCADGSLDQRGLKALGLDQDEVLGYLRDELPSYPQFEAWVVAQKGDGVDLGAIEAFNARLLERRHGDEKRAGIQDMLGRPVDTAKGVLLNHLEDWKYAHTALFG